MSQGRARLAPPTRPIDLTVGARRSELDSMAMGKKTAGALVPGTHKRVGPNLALLAAWYTSTSKESVVSFSKSSSAPYSDLCQPMKFRRDAKVHPGVQ